MAHILPIRYGTEIVCMACRRNLDYNCNAYQTDKMDRNDSNENKVSRRLRQTRMIQGRKILIVVWRTCVFQQIKLKLHYHRAKKSDYFWTKQATKSEPNYSYHETMQASIPNNINMLANAFQNGYHVISHYI